MITLDMKLNLQNKYELEHVLNLFLRLNYRVLFSLQKFYLWKENEEYAQLMYLLFFSFRLFLSQRNVYITGGALYLIPVLYRLHQVLSVVALQGGVAELKVSRGER